MLTPVQLGDGTSAVYLTATGPVPTNWTLESSTDLKNWSWYMDGTDPAVNIQIPVLPGTPQMFFRLTSNPNATTAVPPVVLSLTTVQLGDGTSAINLTGSGTVPAYWIIESSTDLQNWNWYVDGTDPRIDVEIPISPDTLQMFFRLVSP
jgi:hypothetical protein